MHIFQASNDKSPKCFLKACLYLAWVIFECLIPNFWIAKMIWAAHHTAPRIPNPEYNIFP